MNVFSTYHEDGEFQSNMKPQVQYPFIPNKLVTNTVQQTARLVQPQERGTWFGKNTGAKRTGATK